METCNSTDDCFVIFEIAVSVKFYEIDKHGLDIVRTYRTILLSGDLYPLPCSFAHFFGLHVFHCFPGHFLDHLCVLPGFMQFHNLRQRFSQLWSFYNLINKSMLQQELGSLESFRKLLSDGLLDDTRSGKSNQCIRFCKNNVSKHGKARCHAASSRIGQYGHVELSCIMMAFQRC